MAAEVFAQMRDPALAQLVWGHGTAIRHQDPGALLESRFIVTKKRIPLEGGGKFAYDFVEPCDGQLSLLHQLQLTRDYNFLHHPDDFNNLITHVCPLVKKTREDMLLDYVYAVHLQARQRIQMSSFSVSIMGDAVNLSPSWELQRADLDVGSSVCLWSMNTSRAFVLHGQTVNMLRHYHRQRFINQINPLHTSLRAAVEPALIPGRLEPEYAEYARRACLAETGRGDRPVLPFTAIRIGSETYRV
ncbi:hypothetical protein B0H13DRAFT_1854682 [Mycena leptocephala]|nr:hypothetical protein B0H13DRAFT_1854682 [Mycena leptocephala]